MFSLFVSVNDIRKACLTTASPSAESAVRKAFQAPAFFLEYNKLRFHTGVDRQTWEPCFLLAVPQALQLVEDLERKYSISLKPARTVIHAAEHGKYESIQAVAIPTDAMYKAILKSFSKLAKQSKTQALYADSRRMLVAAMRLAHPESRAGPATMFLSLDFEWWERAEDTILEVGWSLWDTVTQQHRTRHWVIKENLNKANGRFISDNRMRFLFGTSERGSLDKAMDALQQEVDAAGITEGLDRQQKDMLRRSGVELVLLGHGMTADVDKAELYEIEWPEGMQKFDTQTLYMAWQLKQLDAAAAAKALYAVVASQNGKDKASTVDHSDLDDDSAEEDNWVEDLLDEEAAEAKAAKGPKSPAVNGSGGATSPAGDRAATPPGKKKGKPQVQNPKRVRPWPAGPPAPDPNRPASATAEEREQGQQSTVKVDHQVSLASVLSAFGIKFGKLHNAGNDARFTMEAFLALTGHPACTDPAQAHLDFSSNDARYQQQLEASIAAAAALGFATPTLDSVSPTPGSAAATPRGGTPAAAASAGGYGGSNTPGRQPGAYSNDSDSDWQRPGSGPRNGRPAAPPGFGGAASIPPPGFSDSHSQHLAVPPGFEAATSSGPAVHDDDFPPGFEPAARANSSQPAATAPSSWAAAAASGRGSRAAAASAAVGGGGGAAAARPASPGPRQAPARQAASVDPLAYRAGKQAAASSGTSITGGAWGAPQQQHKPAASAFEAHNSNMGSSSAAVAYQPNPDGW